ncbi:MAG: hypothetical protein AB7F86_14950 [Bdellovibrionales bacterium]
MMKIYSPNQEERAFLYQEANDLAPLIKDMGTLSVMVQERPTAPADAVAGNRYRVTFVVAPETVGLQIHAENDNLFAATIAAKEEAIRQLSSLVNAMGPGPSDVVILH